MRLTEPVKNGDYLVATPMPTLPTGATTTPILTRGLPRQLGHTTLNVLSYDANWNLVSSPAAMRSS
jgi:hypothetical protein